MPRLTLILPNDWYFRANCGLAVGSLFYLYADWNGTFDNLSQALTHIIFTVVALWMVIVSYWFYLAYAEDYEEAVVERAAAERKGDEKPFRELSRTHYFCGCCERSCCCGPYVLPLAFDSYLNWPKLSEHLNITGCVCFFLASLITFFQETVPLLGQVSRILEVLGMNCFLFDAISYYLAWKTVEAEKGQYAACTYPFWVVGLNLIGAFLYVSASWTGFGDSYNLDEDDDWGTALTRYHAIRAQADMCYFLAAMAGCVAWYKEYKQEQTGKPATTRTKLLDNEAGAVKLASP